MLDITFGWVRYLRVDKIFKVVYRSWVTKGMAEVFDIFSSDTSGHEALIVATLAAERARIHEMDRGKRVVSLNHVGPLGATLDQEVKEAKVTHGGRWSYRRGTCSQSNRIGINKNCHKLASKIKQVIPEYDDLWGRVASLQKRSLIRRWLFSDMEEVDMAEWVKTTWSPILGYNPKVSLMMNSWFIHFMHEDDCVKILRRTWMQGRTFMQLLPWYLGFKLVLEAPKNRLVWVKLLRLPLEFWTLKDLTAIGDSIGRTKHIDPRILGTSDKHIAWLLVEVNFAGGLLSNVDLIWGQRRHRQRVEFRGVLF